MSAAVEITEIATRFDCDGAALVGILTLPVQPARRAVLIAVGGAQYRSGSHRQFTLMARALGQAGLAVLRFDFRGMGDSTGDLRVFDDSAADIAAALEHLRRCVGSVEECVLLGLCDGASAALLATGSDARIHGLVLINPWVGDADAAAATRLQHYYLRRMLQPAFWRKLIEGRWQVRHSLRGFLADLRRARRRAPVAAASAPQLADRMREHMAQFAGPILLLLSGRDLTAQQFNRLLGSSAGWRALARRENLSTRQLDHADHTFSTTAWRAQALDIIIRWNRTW